MSRQNMRDLLAQTAIIMAVCIGAWMMLVKPKMDQLARAAQELREKKAAASNPMNQQAIEAAAKRMSGIRTRLADISACNELANDSSRLYGLIMNLAQANAVHVHSLQPGTILGAPSKPSASADECQVKVNRLNLMLEGSYEDVAMFLDSLCSLEAFIRPVNLHLNPARRNGANSVEAHFGCDVLSFTFSPALAELAAAATQGERHVP